MIPVMSLNVEWYMILVRVDGTCDRHQGGVCSDGTAAIQKSMQ